jgi:hypothetical protein
VQAYFDARFDTPLEEQGLIDGAVGNSLGIDGAAVIRPRDIWRSVLAIRASSTADGIRMPPLARNLLDAEALSVIAQWIDSLPGTPALPPPAILPEERNFADEALVEIVHPDPLATVRYTIDGTSPGSGSPAYEGPFSLTEGAIVSARAYREGYVESVIAKAEFTNVLSGLQGEYFGDVDLSDLRLTRIDPAVDFVWDDSPDPAVPADGFSVRWTGQVRAPFSETFTFWTFTDEGVRLWIDGRRLIDNWEGHPPLEDSGQIALEAGKWYDVRMDLYENDGSAVARLLWSSPSLPKQVIPARHLYSRKRTRPGAFLRGDGNGDGRFDISDPIATLGCLFSGTRCAACGDAADVNDDGRVDIADSIYGLNHLFSGGPAPRPPYPLPGFDPTTTDRFPCGDL